MTTPIKPANWRTSILSFSEGVQTGNPAGFEINLSFGDSTGLAATYEAAKERIEELTRQARAIVEATPEAIELRAAERQLNEGRRLATEAANELAEIRGRRNRLAGTAPADLAGKLRDLASEEAEAVKNLDAARAAAKHLEGITESVKRRLVPRLNDSASRTARKLMDDVLADASAEGNAILAEIGPERIGKLGAAMLAYDLLFVRRQLTSVVSRLSRPAPAPVTISRTADAIPDAELSFTV